MDLQKDAKALGLESPVATPAAVRAAYLRKAKASHPDAGGTKQEFQNIQAAYERLGTQRRHQAAVDARYYARRPNDIIDRINLCGNQNFTARSCVVASSSTPSTRRLLDSVAMPVPRRSTEPGRPRHRREMT